ncbi:ParM/StbA family protein [Proteinivorax tanatarense]|uniref:ParM/StbA family protein n=1 Tax=Proteinivorax tanatarense TaxID=1260629 RepID=A0AAU7VM38_9FIRM
MKEQVEFIGIDKGNGYIKAGSEIIFPAGLSVTEGEPLSNYRLLKYNGKQYNIGDSRLKFTKDKANEAFLVLALAAIAMRLEKVNKQKGDVVLGLGAPISDYGFLKNTYTNYFTKNNLNFAFNGKKYEIDIKKVYCFPQGIAGFLHNYHNFGSEYSYFNLLDFGNITLDAVTIGKDKKPILDSAISLEYGMTSLVKRIQKKVNHTLGISLAEEQVELALTEKTSVFFNERIQEIIEEAKKDFIEDSFKELHENGFKLQGSINVLMGGGAKIVNASIDANNHQKTIGYAEVMPDEQFANSLGFEKLAKQAYLQGR